MLKALLLFNVSIVLQLSLLSQDRSVDAMALKIPQANTNSPAEIAAYIKQIFSTDSSRVRAIYVWVTNNISYDFAGLREHELNSNVERPSQTVEDVLKTRKAVCQGYSNLFVSLCNEVGIKASLIGGYVKRGTTIASTPHAWVGAQLYGTWFLFDPTWGAGYIRNERFEKAFNNYFYKTSPADLIKDHMPFDPMYQFINSPITNKEFIDEQTIIKPGRPFYNYADTLKRHALLSTPDQTKNIARRIEANGVVHELIRKELTRIQKNLHSYGSKDKFEEAQNACRHASTLFTQYIAHKNKQFANVEDNRLRQIIDSVADNAKTARSLLVAIEPKEETNRQVVAKTVQNLEGLQKRVMEEMEFVARYLSTDVTARSKLFRR